MAGPTGSTFAVLLKQLRIQARLTHEELAEKASVAVRTISDLERRISLTPRKETVQGLADALELTGTARDEFKAAAREHRVLPAGSAATRALPRDLASFTGRKPELQWLLDAAAGGADAGGAVGIYAIAGMAGVGKTALALRAAHQIAGQFPDGQLYLDLRGYTDGLDALSAQQALASLLRSLGTPDQLIPEDPEERAAFYRSRLARTRTLIILDNALSTAQVRPLLPGTAGCLVIVTSRRSLRGLDDARARALNVLPEADANTLFRTVAGPERVSADAPALAEIITLCGHLPLAIRIIAARLAHRQALRVEDLARQLRHERGRLAHLQDEDRNISAVFGLSYRHLPDPEQHLFRYLALIPGPDFDAHAAANLTDTELDAAGRLLESLLDHNLLMQRTPGRYRFHDLVRVYARTLISPPVTTSRTSIPGGGATAPGAPDTSAGALDRVLDYYLYTAQAADRHFERRIPLAGEPGIVARPRTGPPLDTPEQAQAWLAAELANLDAATYYAAGHHRRAYAIALPAALAEYLRAHGPWTQALALHQCALDSARVISNSRGQADALAHLGVMQRQSGALARAADSLTQALDLYREPGDRHGQAGVLVELAVVQRLTAQYPQAKTSLTQALGLYSELSDRHGQAGALAELGVVQRQTGAFAQAEDTLIGALNLYRELSNRYGEAAVLSYLGSVQWSTGASARAEHSLTAALCLYRELGDRMGQANNLLYLGSVQREAGAYAQARVTLTETLDLYNELGERRGQAGALAYLGVVQRLTSQYAQADDSLTRAVGLFRELGDRGGEAEALNHYAELIAVTGAPVVARGHYVDALRLAREISSSKDEADALDGIAATYRSEGNISEATTHYRQARALYQSLGCTPDAARVQAVLDVLENN